MSTIKVNTIQSNTTATLDVNSPIPSLDVTGSVSVGGDISASGIVTATSFSGNLTGNVNSTGVTTVTTLSATNIVGVSTLGVTTAYINTLSGISTIDASSAVSINQNLVFASGKGIDFSATANSSGTMTSELLSDYEEGTWTPVWQSTGILPNLSYSVQSGHYRKIGNVVHFWGRIYMNSWGGGGGSGNIRVGGLPFTSSNAANTHKPLCQVTFSYSGGNAVWPSGATQVFAEVINDSTSLQYICLGAPTTQLGDSAPLQWTSNPQMYNNYFSGTYFTS